MSASATVPDWLENEPLQHLLEVLEQDGEEARINGGAVRNFLFGEPVADVDISTTLVPQMVVERLKAAGIKSVPTGIDHGTITAVIAGIGYEITTLRADIETFGRHAVVRFGKCWREDAERRDFTINALYLDRLGEIYDPLETRADIEARKVRFIGNADDRIGEDHLRILRFFRFFAWYGRGAPDREGLKACVRARQSLLELSAERVWKELYRLLAAPEPQRAILWMRQSGVLSIVLPESEKWGIDALPRLLAAEKALQWPIDPLLRLMAIIPPQALAVETLARRLKLANRDRKQLENWLTGEVPATGADEVLLAKALYRGSQQGTIDVMRLELARLREAGQTDDQALVDAATMNRLLDFAIGWQRPVFPVSGKDLVRLGKKPGKAMGKRLKALEKRWIESGFSLSKAALLKI